MFIGLLKELKKVLPLKALFLGGVFFSSAECYKTKKARQVARFYYNN